MLSKKLDELVKTNSTLQRMACYENGMALMEFYLDYCNGDFFGLNWQELKADVSAKKWQDKDLNIQVGDMLKGYFLGKRELPFFLKEYQNGASGAHRKRSTYLLAQVQLQTEPEKKLIVEFDQYANLTFGMTTSYDVENSLLHTSFVSVRQHHESILFLCSKISDMNNHLLTLIQKYQK